MVANPKMSHSSPFNIKKFEVARSKPAHSSKLKPVHDQVFCVLFIGAKVVLLLKCEHLPLLQHYRVVLMYFLCISGHLN